MLCGVKKIWIFNLIFSIQPLPVLDLGFFSGENSTLCVFSIIKGSFLTLYYTILVCIGSY